MGGGRQVGFDVAVGDDAGVAGADDGGGEGFALVEVGSGGFGFVGWGEEGGGFGRGFQGFGDDDGDGLVGVADAVGLEEIEAEGEGIGLGVGVGGEGGLVGGGHDVDDAGVGAGGGEVEARDPAARDGGGGDDGVEHAGGVVVGGVGGAAGDFEGAVAAAEGLADAGALADVDWVLGQLLRHGRGLRRGRREALGYDRGCRRRRVRGLGR